MREGHRENLALEDETPRHNMLCESLVESSGTTGAAKLTMTDGIFQSVALSMDQVVGIAAGGRRVRKGSHGHPRAPHICPRPTHHLGHSGAGIALFALERAHTN